MILQALYELSRSRGLVKDPLYEKKPVHGVLEIDAEGRLLALVETQDERGRGLDSLVPRGPKRSVNVAPGFLVDNSKYVLGLDAPEKQNDERLARCTEAFRELVARCAQETQDAGAAAVLRFLESKDTHLPWLLKQRSRDKWNGSETLVFSLAGDECSRVHERPAVREWWARQNAEEVGSGEDGQRCLVTGRRAPAARLHPSIKRVPQAQSSGASVVSFNADSFTSHGLDQGENAPVSQEAAVGYATALNWLLEGRPDRRYQYGIPLGEDAVIVFWTHRDTPMAGQLISLFDPTPKDLERMAESPWRGLEPEDVDTSAFYAMTLSGNAARVVIRDWLTTTAGKAKANVRRYFEDLRIGSGPEVPVPLRELLRAVTAPSGRGLAPDVASRLFRAALLGTPFPDELLGAALRRLRLPPDPAGESRLLRLRCALIKATLLRMTRANPSPKELTVSLDENNNQVPYLLGRLFAVLERLQGVALGDINATIRDRYFGAASMTPAYVFPRLVRLSMHHAAKAEKTGDWLEGVKSRIVGALPAEPFPPSLSYEQQGLFAIGYYHQREDFFRKRDP